LTSRYSARVRRTLSQQFAEDFVKKQSDEWVKKFYAFLQNQKALWKKKDYYWEKEGLQRQQTKLPIVWCDQYTSMPFLELVQQPA